MEGKQLYRHIVRHVQRKHLDHVGETDQGTQGGRARDDQQQSTCDFGAAGDDFISRGRAHGGPENRESTIVAVATSFDVVVASLKFHLPTTPYANYT